MDLKNKLILKLNYFVKKYDLFKKFPMLLFMVKFNVFRNFDFKFYKIINLEFIN
jgi:hypothetical protein